MRPLVDLEENEMEQLKVEADGSIYLDITKKKIVTIEFVG